MTGHERGLVARVQQVAPLVQWTHYMVNREALAAKKMPPLFESTGQGLFLFAKISINSCITELTTSTIVSIDGKVIKLHTPLGPFVAFLIYCYIVFAWRFSRRIRRTGQGLLLFGKHSINSSITELTTSTIVSIDDGLGGGYLFRKHSINNCTSEGTISTILSVDAAVIELMTPS
ncbi:unnamed protein product [Pleuronectes platessa]|uniref:Uncharacterized protein n=1 Tax=Pleuronectes platessa TaxID=8262 RepID=A0A9N7YVY4_PLEPL|nr:unnamed protein product [Pleuronectes platessa]